tara:strand:+ start:433 stop:783 length:351 start_codon:yes stop_codon:yes gene_type:complete
MYSYTILILRVSKSIIYHQNIISLYFLGLLVFYLLENNQANNILIKNKYIGEGGSQPFLRFISNGLILCFLGLLVFYLLDFYQANNILIKNKYIGEGGSLAIHQIYHQYIFNLQVS